MEYQQLLDTGLAVLAGAAAGGVWFKNRKKPVVLDASAVRELVQQNGKSAIRKQVDHTKRKSLMPQNRDIVPDGWEKVIKAAMDTQNDENPQPKNVAPTEKLKGEFAYRFFGSQLMIGDRVVVGSLPKKLHLLEITVQDQVFIDGVPQNFHIGDIEALKKITRAK